MSKFRYAAEQRISDSSGIGALIYFSDTAMAGVATGLREGDRGEAFWLGRLILLRLTASRQLTETYSSSLDRWMTRS
jgi:hypothetical protein